MLKGFFFKEANWSQDILKQPDRIIIVEQNLLLVKGYGLS